MTTTDDSIADLADRGRQTVARIRAALDSGKSASIAQIVELIREVTCKFETISVQGLGEVIGRDLLTMSRVISVAHTLGYNPEGVEISTINQAIHVIGFNKIRNLALSLMLMQNAATEAALEKRNVAAFALVSGLISQAVRLHQHPDDAEEAFVCAALRNYGRIMLANFLPEEYRRAVAASPGAGEANAFRREFGLTPLELSAALLEQAHMPRNIIIGLRDVASSERSATGLSPELELPVIADFAEALCRLANEPGLDAGQFSEQAMRLARTYGPNVALTEDELFEVLEEIANTLNMFGALQSGHALSSNLLQRLKALALRADPAPSPAAATANRAAAASQASTVPTAGQTPRLLRDPLAVGIATLMELETQATARIDQVYAEALRAIHTGLELDHTLLFRRTDGGAKYFAWLGEGDFFAMVSGEELLDAAVRDVFSVCLKRGEDVLIQNPGDPKIQAFIPDWLRPAAGTQPLVLLPVRDAHGTVAVFCGLRGDSAPLALTPRQSQQLRALRQRLAGFEDRQKANAQTAGAPATAAASPP